MATRTTKLVVEATAKGFKQTADEATKLTTAAAKSVQQQAKGFDELLRKGRQATSMWQKLREAAGFPKMSKDAAVFQQEVVRLKSKLSDLAQQQLKTLKAMEGMDAASDGYKRLEEELKGVNSRAGQARQSIQALGEAFRRESREVEHFHQAVSQSRGAFAQGFLQGVIPGGNLIQRGPGALQQAAGAAVGGGIRGMLWDRPKAVVGGLARAPFEGLSGISAAFQGIPFLGPIAAGQIQTTAGFAGMALEAQQARVQALPAIGHDYRGFLPTGPSKRQVEEVRSKAAKAIERRPFPIASPEGREKLIDEAMTQSYTAAEMGQDEFNLTGITKKVSRKTAAKIVDKNLADLLASAKSQAADTAEENLRRLVTKPGLLGRIREAGRLLPAGESEALRSAAAIAGAGGGTIRQVEKQGLLERGFAAQTLYGVGPEAPGAFLKGVRRGGIAGIGDQKAGKVFEDTLTNAVALGLSDTEVPEYLQIVAQGIQQFQKTGMPFNPETFGKLASTFSRMGLGATRGMEVGKGLAEVGPRIAAQGGPQTPAEMLFFKEAVGFRGGSLKEWGKAMGRAERGEVDLPRFLKVLQSQGEASQAAIQGTLRQLGIPQGWTEAGNIAAGKMRPMEGMEMGPPEFLRGDLVSRAEEAVGKMAPGLGTQVDIQNQQLQVGKKMLGFAQMLEKATTNINTTFAEKVGPGLTGLAEKLVGFTKSMQRAADDLEKTLKSLPGY